MGKEEDQCWVVCDRKVLIDICQYKGNNNHKDKEGGGGVCERCGVEEEVSNSIRKLAEIRDYYWFTRVDINQIGCWKWAEDIITSS